MSPPAAVALQPHSGATASVGADRTGRYCLVVTELLGHRTAGGIATATTFLAELLAAAGHRVTLFDAAEAGEELVEEWRRRYRTKGITLERIDRTAHVAPDYVADSYRTYHQLKHRDFDVIVFQDWRGLGYCSMSAKASGLAFAGTRLVHIVHGPTAWLWEANQVVALDTEEFAAAHIEQRAAELADTVVGPSAYLLDWMAVRWALPADRRHIFYPTARMIGLQIAPAEPGGLGPPDGDRPDGDTAVSGLDGGEAAGPGAGVHRLRELVFFGATRSERVFASSLKPSIGWARCGWPGSPCRSSVVRCPSAPRMCATCSTMMSSPRSTGRTSSPTRIRSALVPTLPAPAGWP